MTHPGKSTVTVLAAGQAASAGAAGPTPASPHRASRVCSESGCPERAIFRGRCPIHYQTTSERGYDPDWQAFSLALRQEREACEDCGSRDDLTVDHLDPHSSALGYRVRCRSCHGRFGAKGAGSPAGPLPLLDIERSLMRVIG